MPPSSVSRLFCFGFGGLRQLEPLLVPSRFVAGFDPGAGTGDIEYIAAALLRLRYEAEGLAAEGMVRCEEVKHLVFLVFRYSYKIITKRSACVRESLFFCPMHKDGESLPQKYFGW